MPLPDSPLCEHGRTKREGCVRCEEPAIEGLINLKEITKKTGLAFSWIHQRCVKKDDELGCDPVTRRTFEASRRRDLGCRPPNHRKAWWCVRCDERVKQTDLVVMVRLKG